MREKGLTAKQKMFVLEYMKDLNATQAAIRAGYSEKTAKQIGEENLSKPYMQAAIEEQMKAREVRTLVTADRVVKELAKVAFADLKDFVQFGPGGVTIRPDDEVDGTMLAEVSETITQAGGSKKVKMYDKLKALELLGRHLAMFTDRLEQKVDGDLRISVAGLNVPGVEKNKS